jgi:hypothetical protein
MPGNRGRPKKGEGVGDAPQLEIVDGWDESNDINGKRPTLDGQLCQGAAKGSKTAQKRETGLFFQRGDNKLVKHAPFKANEKYAEVWNASGNSGSSYALLPIAFDPKLVAEMRRTNGATHFYDALRFFGPSDAPLVSVPIDTDKPMSEVWDALSSICTHEGKRSLHNAGLLVKQQSYDDAKAAAVRRGDKIDKNDEREAKKHKIQELEKAN